METKTASAIRRSLAEAGVSEATLARAAGISTIYLSDILLGRRSGDPVRERIEAALTEILAQAAARK